MLGQLQTVLEFLRELPVIRWLFDRLFGKEDPRVAAAKALGRNNDTMIDAMKEHDDPQDMAEALWDYEPEFKIGDKTIKKDFGPPSPFDK